MNPKSYNNTVRKHANRLRIFRFIKATMEREGVCPSILEVSKHVRLSRRVTNTHMTALRNADGLPFPIPTTSEMKSENASNRVDDHTPVAAMIAVVRSGRQFNPMAPVGVDILMQGPMR